MQTNKQPENMNIYEENGHLRDSATHNNIQ